MPAFASVFFTAFDALSSERTITIVPAGERSLVTMVGGIPWTTVEQYGHAIGLDRDNRQLLHESITGMDVVYRPWRTQEIITDLRRAQ